MHRMVLLLAVSLMLVPVPILASQVTVPDDYATIQAALDSGVDTVFVRSGNYPEALTISGNQSLIAVPDSHGSRLVANPPVVTSLTSTCCLERLRGFVFTGPVLATGGTIEGCWFGAGLTVPATRMGIVCNNIIFGDLDADYTNSDIVMNTIINGTIIANPAGGYGYIVRNVVLGPAATGMRLYSDSRVRDNYVRGCDVGMHLSGESCEAVGNVVEDCSGTGMVVEHMNWMCADSNTIRRCGADGIHVSNLGHLTLVGDVVDSVGGVGIRAVTGLGLVVMGNAVARASSRGMDLSSGALLTMLDNRIVGSGNEGAVVNGQILQVRGNVVGRSGGRGLVVTGEEVTVRSNTLYLNADAGLDLSGTSSAGVDSVDHNIAYQNDVGLRWDGLGTAVLGCNDWYSNPTANTQGISPGATDLSLNPLFCDMAADDVSLSAVSALLNPAGCGLIGALGEGCPYPAAVTPEPGAVLSGLGVFPQPGRGEVRLSWQKTNDVTEVAIYDVTGARRWSVTTAPGAGEVVWRGVDDDGRPLPAGVYFAKVRSGERQAAANVVLVR